ncbi:MAG: hypothetical protein C0501_19890 [Isosphaera sp.]|nr:hypothetical protein [Isosphaera sp.]
MHQPALRIAFSAALLAGIALTLEAAAGDAPIAPTVPPPSPPPGVRFPNLLPGPARVADPDQPADAPADGAEPEFSLADCLAVAVERQPALRAARASEAATAAGFASLNNIGKVGELLSPDLSIRREQAKRGLIAASAEYQKTYNELVQDVTRLYYSAVYARQQEAVATDVIEYVELQIKIAYDILKNEPDPLKLGGLNLGKVQAMEAEVGRVRQELVKARTGRERALAALRERMGVDGRECTFRPKDAELPLMRQDNPVTKGLVVDLALCRRPELALAAAGVDAFRLEVYAQGKVTFKRVVPTLASGADIHAKEIPPAMRGSEYRPGVVLPELPPQLVGSKQDRVARMMALAQRAEAVFDNARGLIQLEAENGFLEFDAATASLRVADARLAKALELQKTNRENAGNVKDKSILVQAELLVSAAQADYVRAVYEHLLQLAALERITAGGIRPAFPGR